MPYSPPLTLTLRLIDLISRISEDTDQVSDAVSDQVKRLLSVFGKGEILASALLMTRLGLKHLPTFRRNYLKPALAAGLIRMTQPDSPNSPTQRYRLASI